MTRPRILLYLTGISLLFGVLAGWYAFAFQNQPEIRLFDGQRSMVDVEKQVSFGPRTPGSSGHAQIQEWMRSELEAAGWESRVQSANMLGHPIQNIIAYRGPEPPRIILGAHYDTRFFADHDPDPQNIGKPVPGANDGASGVAVLIELARVLPDDTLPVWLVFFDAEDNGRIPGWDWILGSQAFVANLEYIPEAVVIVDMVGDADLNLFYERNSDPVLSAEIWAIGRELGYERQFIPELKHSLLDDHTPFLQAGIPAIDIIDFDYPYYHTAADTPDKVSAQSLEAVGRTLQEWLIRRSAE